MTRVDPGLHEDRDALMAQLEALKRENRLLREREAQLRAVVTHLDDPVAVLDREGRILWANPSGYAFVGAPAAHVQGKTLDEVFPPDLAAHFGAQLEQVLESGEPLVVHERLTHTGLDRTFLSTKYPYRSETGEMLGVIGVARDITESDAMQEALKSSERRLLDIIESSTNLFYIHTADHVLTYVSPHTQDFFECDPEEALVSWMEFVTDHPVNQLGYAATQRAIETGERQPPYELELVGKKQRKIWVEVREAPLVRDGKTVAITGSLTDITERKRMEEALREQNEQLRELDRLKNCFVGSVSHELRTPLTSIVGYAEFLEDELGGPLTASQRGYVDAILEGAERLGFIVDDLLDFARLESGAFRLSPRDANLNQKVREAVNSLLPQAGAARLTLSAEVPEAAVVIFADIDRLGQVLLNLLGNAIKFTPAGGTVSVTLEDDGDAIRLRVQDTGIGIPESQQDQIFEKFYQVDPSNTRTQGGAGLGLAISKALVEAHGGAIALESASGAGSTFTITLSRARLEALRPQAVSEEDAAPLP